MTFSGKTVAVTGAASGIGAASAVVLKDRGAQVVGLDINEPAAGAVDRYVAYDQGDPGSIDRAVAAVPDGLDGLLNIAGVPPSPRFGPVDVLKINFFGLRYFTEKVVDKLSDGAAIVNMSSGTGAGWPTNVETIKAFFALDRINQVAGFVADHGIGNEGLGNDAAYPLSKQLLSVWTMKASSRWKDRGIRVNAVAPAAVETPIVGDFLASFGEEAAKRIQTFGSATPEQVALATTFLLSADAAWINGAVVPVDGGAIAGRTMAQFGI